MFTKLRTVAVSAAALVLVVGCSGQMAPEPSPPPARVAEAPPPEPLAGAPPVADRSGLLGGPVAEGARLPPARVAPPARTSNLITYRDQNGKLITAMRPVFGPGDRGAARAPMAERTAAAPPHRAPHKRHHTRIHAAPPVAAIAPPAHKAAPKPVKVVPATKPAVVAAKPAPAKAVPAKPAAKPVAVAKPVAKPATGAIKPLPATKPLPEPKTVEAPKAAAPPQILTTPPKIISPSALTTTDPVEAQPAAPAAAPAPAPAAKPSLLDQLNLPTKDVEVPGVGKVSSKSLLGGGLVLLAMIILVLLARRLGENERLQARRRKFRTMTDYGTGPIVADNAVSAPEDFNAAAPHPAPAPDVIYAPAPEAQAHNSAQTASVDDYGLSEVVREEGSAPDHVAHAAEGQAHPKDHERV